MPPCCPRFPTRSGLRRTLGPLRPARSLATASPTSARLVRALRHGGNPRPDRLELRSAAPGGRRRPARDRRAEQCPGDLVGSRLSQAASAFYGPPATSLALPPARVLCVGDDSENDVLGRHAGRSAGRPARPTRRQCRHRRGCRGEPRRHSRVWGGLDRGAATCPDSVRECERPRVADR